MLNMASESGLPNNKAARDLPLQRCGIKAQARRTYGGLCGDVQVKLGGNTVFVPLLGWSFFLPVSAILISGFQIYYKIIFKKERYVL